MTLNPNWPVLDYAISWAAGRTATPLQDLWSSVTERTEGQVQVKRGKQYELDQVQPGEMTLTLRNDDGAFDNTNSSSPFFGFVIPYRLMRLRAQWSPTVNMLTADQATAFYATKGAGGTGSALPQWVYAASAFATSIVNSGTKNWYSVAVPAAGAAGNLLKFTGWSVTPGASFSAQCQAYAATTGLTSAQLSLAWFTASGTLISTSNGAAVALTTVAQSVTVSAAAPANAAGAVLYFATTAAPASAVAVNCSTVQVEKAAAPTAWVQPGTWYDVFTGYVERWPQSWSSGGNYGTVALDVVDLFGFLSQADMNYAAYLEVLALGPTWFYPLDDQSGATVFHDLTGHRSPASILTAGPGPLAALTPGASLTGTDVPLGIPGPVLEFNPGSNGSAIVSQQVVDLTAGGINPAGPASAAWTRMIAFRTTTWGTSDFGGQALWGMQGKPIPGGTDLIAAALGAADANGHVNSLAVDWFTAGINTGALATPGTWTALLNDGSWHLLIFGQNAAGTAVAGWLDGVALSNAATTLPTDVNVSDQIGSGITLAGQTAASNLINGDVAFLAEIPYLLSNGQAVGIYQAFEEAWQSNSGNAESSGTRYARLLAWMGLGVYPQGIDAGASVDYGPAIDIQGGTSPTATLDALESVVDSEVSQHFIAADGTITFQSRRERVNPAPAVTFGEHAGEIPYLSAIIDNDPTRVSNVVTTTATSTLSAQSSTATVTDQESIDDYGTVSLQRTMNTLDPNELIGGAQYLLYQNKQPQPRLEQLPVDVGANPSLWPALLGLELGTAATVNRRPSGAPAMSLVGFLEQVVWAFDDAGHATWSGQVSNAADHYFGEFDSATYGEFDSTLIFGF